MRECKPVMPTDGGAPGPVRGWLEPSVIQSTARQSFDRFRACYETGLRSDPALAGKVAVKFVIERDGHVVHSELAGTTLRDPEVVRCVVDQWRTVVFPPPKCDAPGPIVVYPIDFGTAADGAGASHGREGAGGATKP